MASTVTITDIVNNSNGQIEVLFDDSTSFTFPSIEEMHSAVSQYDSSKDITKFLAIAWILARQPALANIAAIQGKLFTFDMSAPNPIRVQ